jgi:hypothetical protein
LEHGNGETENQAKKSAAYVRRAFQGGNSLAESVALLPAMPRICLAAVVFEPLQAESSRTKTRPSLRGTSSGCQAGLWSNWSGSDSDRGLAWLNQFRSGSSSGILWEVQVAHHPRAARRWRPSQSPVAGAVPSQGTGASIRACREVRRLRGVPWGPERLLVHTRGLLAPRDHPSRSPCSAASNYLMQLNFHKRLASADLLWRNPPRYNCYRN